MFDEAIFFAKISEQTPFYSSFLLYIFKENQRETSKMQIDTIARIQHITGSEMDKIKLKSE